MKKLLLFALATISSSVLADGFNFATYQPASVAEITEKWNGITKGDGLGLSTKQPEKLVLSVTSISAPFQCDPQPLVWALTMLGAKSFLQQAPTNHCIKIGIGDASPEVIAYIQDALVPNYVEEVQAGSLVKLYVAFLAYRVGEVQSKSYPILLVNEFQAP